MEASKDCDETAWSSPNELDTMAAAKAEVGQFNEAASYEEKAIALLEADSAWRKNFANRLALYQAQKPFRDEPSH